MFQLACLTYRRLMGIKLSGVQAAVKAAAEAEATASLAREASNLEASSKHSRSMEVDDSSTPSPAITHKLRSAGASPIPPPSSQARPLP